MINIPCTSPVEFILTHRDNFWDNLLSRAIDDDTSDVYISTFNFNFQAYRNSMYNKIATLGETNGRICTHLIYSVATNGVNFVQGNDLGWEFSTYLYHLPNNHAKIFLTNKLCYIGSSNFSSGSNSNYECGTIVCNPLILEEIREKFFKHLEDNGQLLSDVYDR